MRNLFLLLCFACNLLCFSAMAQHSNCSPYSEPITVTQPNGEKINLKIMGNEVFHYYQTIDGYTVLQNPIHSGAYEYATLNKSGELTPSGATVNSNLNKQQFIKGLKPSKQQIAAAYNQFKGNTPSSQFNKAAQNGTFPSVGKRKLLVVLIQFPDEQTVFPKNNFERLMSEENYSDNGCSGSFRDFYLANSNGKLDLDVTVLGWFTAAKPRIEYGQKDAAGNNNPNYNSNVQALIAQTIDSAEAAGTNFQDYDNDGDGELDGLVIFHSGFGAEQGRNGYIWSHRWSLWGSNSRNYDGVNISNYCINPSKRDFGNGTTQVRVGVVTHEFGHILGLPDLYDTDQISEGAGNWCLMAGGPWMNSERTPCRLNAWCKSELGWLTPTVIGAKGNYSLINSSDSNIAYLLNTPSPNEYFLLENRQQKLWDKYLPGRGLAIWHIDLNKANSYKLFGSNDVNTDTAMYGVGLKQADGLRELERGVNRGNAGDLFPGPTANNSFTMVSNPNSALHEIDNNGNRLQSNVNIINITQQADSIVTFSVGVKPVANFTTTNKTGCAPLKVSFTNLSIFNTSSNWNFGNGLSSSNTNETVTFQTPGQYNVSLIVFDELNDPIDTFEATINVLASPKAGFTVTRDSNTVKFNNTSTGADYYVWRFSNNTSSFSTEPSFTFTTPLSFFVVAFNNGGCNDTAYGNLWYSGLLNQNSNTLPLTISPNPFSDEAIIAFELTENEPVTIVIFNLLGEQLSSANYNLGIGKHEVTINNQLLSKAGVYLVKVSNNHKSGYKRLIKQ